ncbi:acyl-CoA dehydrogenase [Mycolicibacterium fluoranthenivorans]|uniref:Acyl-CoA dehydrogenase n=1 Tax=Mycolicibacterium fluoranthenivorans TaxID=258505 RepID=A0A7G8PG67_9MYCO|nr:acyl-CoA dehydrogenase family protein [Mycolicibacterium fluoranthenivorans]QNJ93333.1 acyl-CoA dehydrogenase [Mycolicibacterium fluoranthenivorans]
MNHVIDADTERLLSDSLREMLNSAHDVASGLDELGWSDVAEIDSAHASRLLFTELGRAGRASAQLDHVCTEAAGFPQAENTALIHPLRDTPMGSGVDGVVLSPLSSGDTLLAVAAGPQATAVRIDVDTATPLVRPVGGFDVASGVSRLRIPAAELNAAPVEGDWGSAVSQARVALSWELIGNAEAMLKVATSQIAQRQQFGRPIGSYQSPRHRMADCHTKIVAARELVMVAQQVGDSWSALTAKAYSGMAWYVVMRGCLQVCGAIGLTAEHPLGALVTRGAIVESLYGNWRELTVRVGSDLLAARAIPAGAPL